MATRKKILWLVSWYPNKYDPFDGDFIQRHARAAALFDDVHVIFIKGAEQQVGIEEECSSTEGLTEQIIYFPKREGFLQKPGNFLQWQSLYNKAIKNYCKNKLPQLIHVHIPWKAGLIALWARKKYKLLYIVTEHWGIYNNVAEDNIHTKSFLQRIFLKKIFKEANKFISVSKFLGEGVNATLVKKRYTVLPNVVDTELFHPGNEKHKRFTFLHVSNMVALKNVEGIILAFHQFLMTTRAEAQLILIGNRDTQYHQMADSFGLLNRSLFFRGEVPYEDVAKEMQYAHVFILNSNIENSPCVIGEALCSGLPVIATDVGGISELVTAENSLLVNAKDDDGLSNAMRQIHQQYHQFNAFQTASLAKQKFSFFSVGSQLHVLYKGLP
jgi:glycosyltransferase involved in cell wall biosynthesis